ncbi:MAG: hypothetical protein IIA64_00195, partial [Planctomycetes bacterium]|nr:hypothetical protein [Planctomycetota bacterium]
MRPWQRIVGFVVLLAVVSFGLVRLAKETYFDKKSDLVRMIAATEKSLAAAKAENRQRRQLDDRLQEIIDRTLGADLETVDHQLRTRLNRIGEELGISGLTVGTGQARKLESPARNEFSRRKHPELRNEIDFVELEGWISGETSFEGALRLVHRIDAEPWLKHLDQVRLQPKDNGERFAVVVRLTTLFLPDRAPSEVVWAAYDGSTFDRYLALAQDNIFRVPPATEPTQATLAVPTTSGQDQ